MLLYTKGEKWLKYSKECAHYASSWVMSYNYNFPKRSEFSRLNIKAVGSVFANLQNKHSSPAICVLSGDCLIKLYKFTGEKLYLELIKDIALSIGQYLATKERPIYDCYFDPDMPENEKEAFIKEHELGEGFMCERVNTSDWENYEGIGNVFNGSCCWCETADLLTIVEVIPELLKLM